MITFDKGPTAPVAQHFAALPSYEAHRTLFWFDWGPVFYRGRLDGTARLLCVASDPGPTERVAGRTLVGDAGQRVQGLLTKLGLTHSYLCINAYAYALFPSAAQSATPMLHEPEHVTWRNTLISLTTGPSLQAVVAFGVQAQEAMQDWDNPRHLPLVPLPHPSSHDASALASAWHDGLTQLRGIVTPDSDGDATGPNYGPTIQEADYARIPRIDLPFGVPDFLGDDAWGRTAHPAHNNGVERPPSDFEHTLVWQAPSTD
jgi:hypothetical protein